MRCVPAEHKEEEEADDDDCEDDPANPAVPRAGAAVVVPPAIRIVAPASHYVRVVLRVLMVEWCGMRR